MLNNQWYAVCRVASVGRRPLGLTRFGRRLVLWRNGEVIACAPDACPHRGAALSRGRVQQGQLECPYHGLRFATDGQCTRIPCHPDARRERFALAQLPVRQARGLVWVWHGDDTPGELPWDDALEAELRGEGGVFVDLEDTFDVPFQRIMENLTDYHHVPFVHRWTVPVPAEVTHFSAQRDGLSVHTEGCLGGRLTASTHIRGPFTAVLSFAGTARFATVICPIDEHNTWLFARYTQSALTVPGLRWLATRLLGAFDYRLLQRLQDAPVWRSQQLADPSDIRAYHLLPADKGVALYFALLRELS